MSSEIYQEIISLKKPTRHFCGAFGPLCVFISCSIVQFVQQYVLPGEDDPSCLDKNLFSRVLRFILKIVLH